MGARWCFANQTKDKAPAVDRSVALPALLSPRAESRGGLDVGSHLDGSGLRQVRAFLITEKTLR